MIRIVGANPAMDRISMWPSIRLGEVNRASSVVVVAGGKGFNVARAVIRLGAPAVAYGFLGGRVGEALRAMIVADGVIDRHTDIVDGTRVCFIVIEPQAARSTVLNEPGPHVTDEESERLLATLRQDIRPADIVILSGRLPDSSALSPHCVPPWRLCRRWSRATGTPTQRPGRTASALGRYRRACRGSVAATAQCAQWTGGSEPHDPA